MTTDPLTTLLLLDAYANAHDEGCKHFREAMWNLTKARRSKLRGAIVSQDSVLVASHVREEVRPRIVLKMHPTDPELVDDELDGKQQKPSSTRKSDKDLTEVLAFSAVDPLAEQEKEKENRAIPPVAVEDALNTSTGLRQRKSALAKKQQDSPIPLDSPLSVNWIVEENVSDEERLLRAADPLDLFGGFPPKELRLAQKEARLALESLIRAANVKLALDRQMKL